MTIDEKRLAMIRRAASECQADGTVWADDLRDLLAMLDATREDMRTIIAAAYPAQPDATPTVRGLCEHIGALHDAMGSAEKRADDAERKLAALHAALVAADAALHDAGQQLCGTIRADVGGVLRNVDASLAVRRALADAAPVAERHDREVRVKELRRLADGVEQTITGSFIRTWLRDEADRIERGET